MNRTGAGSVGMRVGAYHFARPTGGSDATVVASAIAQADAFLAFAQPRPGDLLPALDLETTGGLSASRLTAWTQAWLDEVAAEFGVKAIIYASTDFWKTALGDTSVFAAAGHALWIAHWTKAALPSLPGGGWGGRSWLFWQWTDCESVPGIAHCVDGDRFNGTSLATATIPALPSGRPVSTARPSIVGTPQAGWLLAAIPGRWGGGKPASFAYRWRRCDAAGAGCVPIAGAGSETYTPTTADVGHALVVSATATAGGRAVAVSRPTLAVAGSGAPSGSAPAPVSPPTIQGRAQAAGAFRAGRDVDRIAKLLRLPVAALRSDRDGLRSDPRQGFCEVHDHPRRHRRDAVARGDSDRARRLRLGGDGSHPSRRTRTRAAGRGRLRDGATGTGWSRDHARPPGHRHLAARRGAGACAGRARSGPKPARAPRHSSLAPHRRACAAGLARRSAVRGRARARSSRLPAR